MFKKGDTVICVDDSSQSMFLTKGKEYLVTRDTVGSFVFVCCNSGKSEEFFSSRFRPSNKTRVSRMFSYI